MASSAPSHNINLASTEVDWNNGSQVSNIGNTSKKSINRGRWTKDEVRYWTKLPFVERLQYNRIVNSISQSFGPLMYAMLSSCYML